MSNATITAQAPNYALDGSRGYALDITRGWHATGWIRTSDDGHTVYATIAGAPWRSVGTVTTPAELTPAWIADNSHAILQSF